MNIKRVLTALIAVLLIIEVTGYGITTYGYKAKKNNPDIYGKKKLKALIAENRMLKERTMELRPAGMYILVDTATNVLYLNEGKKTLLKATVSCGSGSILSAPSGNKQWIFETPRGGYSIQSKYVKPTWIRPDWAFIEEGEAVPERQRDRAEEGVLGDYALAIGNGYFIHGTLYTRLLGRNVTHGCIRAGDKDLKTLYETVPIGTRVFIF